MDPDKLQRLRKNHILLKADIDTVPVLDHLYSEGIFSDEQCELVRSQKTREERNHELLAILKRTGNRGYDVFLKTLRTLGSHLAEKLEQTPIDQEIIGQPLTENIFFNPSDDFELKGLIDQLTRDGSITQEHLKRMQHYVIGEAGCSETVIGTKDSPESLLRHLMAVKLLTRYNLAFLQSLLWKVDLKHLCQDVATFARKSDKEPVFFYMPEATANGFIPCELHVQGNISHFNGVTIEDICYRISRYAGVDRSHVVPAGIKPSNSLVLTLWIPEHVHGFLATMDDLSWLVDLGVDSITIQNKRITLEGQAVSSDDEKAALERELQKKLESEKLLKQCLYNEQIDNENIRSMYDEKELECKEAKENMNQQSRMNINLFCALMNTLHLVSQLLRNSLCKAAREPSNLRERSARAHYKDVIRRAKLVCNPSILQEVIDANSIIKDVIYSRQINWLVQSFRCTFEKLQANCLDATMYSAVGKMLGTQPVQLPSQPQAAAAVQVRVEAKPMLQPDFDGILIDMAKKLTPKQAAKIVEHYRLQSDLKSEAKKHMVFRQITLEEATRTSTLTYETVDRLMEEATTKIAGRRDLWEEFKSRVKKRRQFHARNQSEIPERLDNIERLLKHLVAQNMVTPFSAAGPYQTEGLKIPAFTKENPYFPFQRYP